MEQGYIVFLDDADVKHTFKDKGKLNKTKKVTLLHIIHFYFSLKFSNLKILYLTREDFELLPGIPATAGYQLKTQQKHVEDKFDYCEKKGGNEQSAY